MRPTSRPVVARLATTPTLTAPPTAARRHVQSALTIVVALCAVAVAAGVLGLLAAAPASAHDALVSTSPADGATLVSAPDRVTLTFDEPALAIGTVLRVIGPAGDVQSGAPRLVDSTVTQELSPGIPAGRYRIAWRVTSADGHPVSGEVTFTASAANPRALSRNTPTTTGVAVAADRSGSGGSTPAWAWVLGLVVLVLLGLGLRRRRRGPTVNGRGAARR